MIRVFLIGYMGVGKTTYGQALADRLNIEFYDLDWYISSRRRKTIAAIFDEAGAEGFRTIERNVLHEVAEFENVMVSCGGGTPCYFDNIDYLNQQGITIYLKASVDFITKNLILSKNDRPLLKGKTGAELDKFVRTQLAEREEFYNKAQYIIDVSDITQKGDIEKKVDEIIKNINL